MPSENPIECFDHSTKDDFWEEFSDLLDSRNGDYILSRASNVVSVANIKFPPFSSDIDESTFFTSTSSMEKTLVFTDCIFDGIVDFSRFRQLRTVKFDNCTFVQKANISLRPFKDIYINNSTFEGGVQFKGVIVNSNDRLFILKNSTIQSTINIEDCYFEFAQFNNINLEDATVQISNSMLVGMKANNVKWGKIFDCDRDTFRQLKVVMDQHKNFIDSNFFHSLELNEYRKELFKTSFFNKFEEKLLFSFNWVVSNFSTSWLRPLVLLIIFSVMLYCILCYKEYISSCNINGFFEFFNPLSKTASTEYKNIYWIWFLHKIISGFFLYHFIIALKRGTRI